MAASVSSPGLKVTDVSILFLRADWLIESVTAPFLFLVVVLGFGRFYIALFSALQQIHCARI